MARNSDIGAAVEHQMDCNSDIGAAVEHQPARNRDIGEAEERQPELVCLIAPVFDCKYTQNRPRLQKNHPQNRPNLNIFHS